MKKLCELVDVSVNNEKCVVFKVQDNVKMDLIALGCFKGNEDMIRMTKGRTPEITVFNKDGSDYSYHFGEGSTTIVSENMRQQKEMIRECAILDYGIVCDWSHEHPKYDYDKLVKDTSSVSSIYDALRNVSLNSIGGMSCNIRINEQTMAQGVNVNDVQKWFNDRGYEVSFERDIIQGLSCGNTYGYCEPIESIKTIDVNVIKENEQLGGVDILNEDKNLLVHLSNNDILAISEIAEKKNDLDDIVNRLYNIVSEELDTFYNGSNDDYSEFSDKIVNSILSDKDLFNSIMNDYTNGKDNDDSWFYILNTSIKNNLSDKGISIKDLINEVIQNDNKGSLESTLNDAVKRSEKNNSAFEQNKSDFSFDK